MNDVLSAEERSWLASRRPNAGRYISGETILLKIDALTAQLAAERERYTSDLGHLGELQAQLATTTEQLKDAESLILHMEIKGTGGLGMFGPSAHDPENCVACAYFAKHPESGQDNAKSVKPSPEADPELKEWEATLGDGLESENDG
jgi:hypothetical protein